MKSREPTEFEQRVYAATRRIPKGCVTTYKKLAREIGCGSNQAVGQALKRNPFAPEVPCHRVVKTDRTLGGFHGQTQGKEITRKTRMLREEGVVLDGAGRVPTEHVFAY
ncbi:MAG: MGMT family protein [Verrucomicrobia bacterium]|nr:MGMT family protein [Verrucomicrobiota bacterium]